MKKVKPWLYESFYTLLPLPHSLLAGFGKSAISLNCDIAIIYHFVPRCAAILPEIGIFFLQIRSKAEYIAAVVYKTALYDRTA